VWPPRPGRSNAWAASLARLLPCPVLPAGWITRDSVLRNRSVSVLYILMSEDDSKHNVPAFPDRMKGAALARGVMNIRKRRDSLRQRAAAKRMVQPKPIRINRDEEQTRMSEENPWKPKDLVRVKSGGPPMTVAGEDSRGMVLCEWFDGSNQKSGAFHPAVLVKYEPPPGSVRIIRS